MRSRKIIILSMFIIGTIISISIYFIANNKKYTIKAGNATVAVLLDGKSVNSFPSKGFYDVAVDCSSGKAKWDYQNWKLVVGNITEKVYCDVIFTTSSKTNLNDKIKSLANNGQVYKETVTLDKSTFTPINKLERAHYINLTNDASYPWTWNEADKSWTSTNKNIRNNISAITFSPNNTGYYSICYKQESDNFWNYGTIYKDNKKIKSLENKNYLEYTCTYLGKLSTSSQIKVEYKDGVGGNVGTNDVTFYLQKGNSSEEFVKDISYRYEGKNVDNYVWFNNELWRIIGVLGEERHGLAGQELVKIIRTNSLGGIAFDKSNSNVWEISSLKSLLNGAYLNHQNGNNTAADSCYQYYKNNTDYVKGDCDYADKGISNDYQNMIKEVYWKVGEMDVSNTAEEIYIAESAAKTSQTAKIGLMYLSDYGYSAPAASCERTTNLNAYKVCSNSSWIAEQGSEWTIGQYSDAPQYVSYVTYNGEARITQVYQNNTYRPVVYLDSNVYTYAGNGTKTNPYIIDM